MNLDNNADGGSKPYPASLSYAEAYVADCELANQSTTSNSVLPSSSNNNAKSKQPTYVTPDTYDPYDSNHVKMKSGAYQPPVYYKGNNDNHGLFVHHEYKHGTGEYIPVRYKHTLSFACCCHYAIDCLAIALVIAFMAGAGWVCYYALNNGGG